VEAGVSEIGASGELLLSATDVIPPAIPQTEERVESGHRAVSLGLKVWLGRVCICWLAASLPVVLGGTRPPTVLKLAAPLALAWLISVGVAEESSRERRPAYGTVPWTAWLALVGVSLVSLVARWFPAVAVAGTQLAVSAGVFAAAASAWELLVRRSGVQRRSVAVIGSSDAAAALVDALRSGDTAYSVVGMVDDGSGEDSVVAAPLLGSLDALPQILERARPDVALLANPATAADAVAAITAFRGKEISAVGVAELYEHAFGRLPLEHLSSSWFIAAAHLYRRPYNRISKRIFDVVVAAFGLVVTAPLFVLIAVLVRQTKGPIIYRQLREGEGGRVFTMCKFRTMVDHAEPEGVPVWAAKADLRTTRVGRVLRGLRLDELPQLWNVLQGTMSIVGPRPERPELCAALSETVPYWSRRTILKPGITGWAQINTGYAFDTRGAESKLSYDLWYLRHRSLLVDLAICVRTLGRLTAGAR
jgi:exopolysaccharide biosynthesis polyprenyl glycosylphosphotransferase